MGGGALVSCSTSTPINHIVFFWQNTSCIRKSQVISGGGGVHPLHPPPRSALPLYVSGKLLTNPSLKPALTLTSHSYWWWITIQTWVVLLIRSKFSTKQKHCSGLNSDMSSVPNFCSCSSFSCGNQWWCTTESAGCFPTSLELHNKDGECGTRP